MNFIRNDKSLEVNHKDGVKTNNNLLNLELITRKENQKHACVTGLQKLSFGSRNGSFKGNITATNITTGSVIIMCGLKDIESNGFSSKSVYKCASGKQRAHKNHTFTRDSANTI